MNDSENLRYSLPVPVDHQYEHLKRHNYPIIFKVIIFLFFIVLSFFLSQFHKYKELNNKIKMAEEAFQLKDYGTALTAYNQLIELYPNYHKGVFRVIQTSYALAALEDKNFLLITNYYLSKAKLYKEDMDVLNNYFNSFQM